MCFLLFCVCVDTHIYNFMNNKIIFYILRINKRPTGLDAQLSDIIMNTTMFFDHMGSYS